MESLFFNNALNISDVLTLLMILIILICNIIQYQQMQKQLRIQNEQIKNNFFAEYTKRYQEIILHFPESINDESFSYENFEKGEKDKIMRYMRVYFDLCSEEYFLHTKKHLDKVVWAEWEAGMIYAFNKPAFKKAWKIVTQDSGFYTEFKKYVELKIIKVQES